MALLRTMVVFAFVFLFAIPRADAQVKPYFQIVVDTSGSMGTCGVCAVVPNSCGQPQSRLNAAKCVLGKMINAYGDVTFGLSRFDMICGVAPFPVGDVYTSSCGPGGQAGSANRGRMLVPIQDNNQNQILAFVDFAPTYPNPTALACPGSNAPPEILVNDSNYGRTPLAGALRNARRYYEGGDPDFPTSPIAGDPFLGCRPYHTILLTDGLESCSTNADVANAAAELRATVVPATGTFDIKTFVIGFGVPTGDPNIEAIAIAGGTDAPGPNRGFYANDETALSLAFSQIIQASLLVEVCNNLDDDCDGLIDEGFAKYCNIPAAITTPILCVDPGDPCDGIDDNCANGILDEPVNACNMCGPVPTEVCNGVDDNCNGFIDEGNVCGGCNPQAEICDGLDNDCDGLFDEGISRPCGNNVGVCTPGTEICIEQVSQQMSGTWGPCSGVAPSPELCDGLDNDCDGLVDGFARECYTFGSGCVLGVGCDGICQTGTQLCSGGWGACVGEIGPATEVCNGLDDNCNGLIDEGDPGGGIVCGSTCGMGLTECQNGMIVCVGGMGSMPEVCNGFDDDCDTLVDEGNPDGGGPCDENGTLCVPGVFECIGGALQCIGGIAPQPEVCDCLDNDCDGEIDEENPDPLCPTGATCLAQPYCLCARPCAPGEFPCPAQNVCTEPTDPPNGFCVPDVCAGVTCLSEETCVDGACVPICDTVTCSSPLVCRPTDGRCVEDNCNGFPDRCAQNEFCVNGTCIADPCDGVTCPIDEFCREGACISSCAGVSCPMGESCEAGACVSDVCGGVPCPEFRVCDPNSGECVQDQCIGVTCPPGQSCDPIDGTCVTDLCLGIQCPGGQVCREGNCFDPSDFALDAGVDDRMLITAGGGGCGCAVTKRVRGTSVWTGLLFLGLVALRRRRRQ